MSDVYNIQDIASFVVLDVETTGFRGKLSDTAITELCMYGFPATELKTKAIPEEECDISLIPTPPRRLRKLTLLFNPSRGILRPGSTDLDNDMLEHETLFNENAAEMILSFLNTMQQPICIVQHNTTYYDCRLMKMRINQLGYDLPITTLVLDSVNTIWSIDKQLKSIPATTLYTPKYEYKLRKIYQRFFGKYPEVEHHAEADVETLLRLMQVYGEKFLNHARRLAKPANEAL